MDRGGAVFQRQSIARARPCQAGRACGIQKHIITYSFSRGAVAGKGCFSFIGTKSIRKCDNIREISCFSNLSVQAMSTKFTTAMSTKFRGHVYKVSRSCLQSFAVTSCHIILIGTIFQNFGAGVLWVFLVNYTLCGGHERRGTPWKMENGAIVLCGGQTYGESSSYIG